MKIELTLIATDVLEIDVFLDNDKLFDKYITLDRQGFSHGLEGIVLNNADVIPKLFAFLFKKSHTIKEVYTSDNTTIVDLSNYKKNCINFEELENSYPHWIEESEQENTMDEYGTLLSLISYIKKNEAKKFLFAKLEFS
jgi:hypothetical protein